MTTTTQVKLIGGPLSGQNLGVDANSVQAGQIFQLGDKPKSAGNTTVQTKHHYRLDPHPSEGFVLSWVNPADRRRYGH